MEARLKDVAALAEVSVRTVSNVVTGSVSVSAATRARVQAAIDQLGYRPNLAARQLRRGRTGVISLVVPEIDSPYFAELAAAIARQAQQRGLLVHIDQTDGDPQRERAVLAGTAGQQVDGIIFSPWSLTPEALFDRAPGIPLVVLGEQPGSGQVDRVAVDNVAAAAAATAHLLESGRQRLVALGPQPHLRNRTAVQRLEGFLLAHQQFGVDADADLQLAVRRLHRRDGWEAIAGLVETGTGFDGIFAFTDQLALGAMRSLTEHGRRIPVDVAVVGFDGIEDGSYSSPTLSTIAPDKQRIAELAIQRLHDRIADPTLPPEELIADHSLLVRESSATRPSDPGGPGPDGLP